MSQYTVFRGGILGLLGLFFVQYSVAEPAKTRFYGAHLCGYPDFKCVSVKRGDTWKSMFPDQREREMVKRLNRTNVALYYRTWIVVPVYLDDVQYMDLSPFPHRVSATGKRHLKVDLSDHAFAAYDQDGKLVHWGPISGGKGWCPDTDSLCRTALGEHKVYRKQGAGCRSSKYPIETNGGARMPYCMHYYRGYAIHGSNLPGYHASHGCVRLFDEDAKWLNQSFLKIGSPVTVTE